MPSTGAPGSSSATEPAVADQSTGGDSDLEVLDPEQTDPSDSAEDPTWDESSEQSSEQSSSEASAAATAAAGGQTGASDPASSSQSGGGQVGGQPGGLPGDPVSELDAELNHSLDVFDQDMQNRITVLADNRAGGGLQGEATLVLVEEGFDTGQDGEQVDQTGQPNALILVDGDVSLLPPIAGDENQQGNSSSGSGGGGSHSARVPYDIGDGSDDDVVARQLREAAVNEDDPVLRDKLWQEYRNYKKSL